MTLRSTRRGRPPPAHVSTSRSCRQAGPGVSGQPASHQHTCSVIAVGLRCGHPGMPWRFVPSSSPVARGGGGPEEATVRAPTAAASRTGPVSGPTTAPPVSPTAANQRGEAAEVGGRELGGAVDGADREDGAGEGRGELGPPARGPALDRHPGVGDEDGRRAAASGLRRGASAALRVPPSRAGGFPGVGCQRGPHACTSAVRPAARSSSPRTTRGGRTSSAMTPSAARIRW